MCVVGTHDALGDVGVCVFCARPCCAARREAVSCVHMVFPGEDSSYNPMQDLHYDQTAP